MDLSFFMQDKEPETIPVHANKLYKPIFKLYHEVY